MRSSTALTLAAPPNIVAHFLHKSVLRKTLPVRDELEQNIDLSLDSIEEGFQFAELVVGKEDIEREASALCEAGLPGH